MRALCREGAHRDCSGPGKSSSLKHSNLLQSKSAALHHTYRRRLARHRHREPDAVDTRELAVSRITRDPEIPGKNFGDRREIPPCGLGGVRGRMEGTN